MTKPKITLEVTIENILDNISEHNNRHIDEIDAENLLVAIQPQVEDWFNNAIDTVIVNAIENVIDDVMDVTPDIDGHNAHYRLKD